MIIPNETVFQWIVTLVIGALTWLGGVAVRNNRERFTTVDEKTKEVEQRVSKLEDRINNRLPEAMEKIHAQINTLDGKIGNVNTKVDLISSNVITRMDKLEKDLPSLIEGALYKFIASGKLVAPGINPEARD